MEKIGMSPEVVVGEPVVVIQGLEVIDFLVVDSRKNEFAQVLKAARFGIRGAVVVCKNANFHATVEFRWRSLFDSGSRRIVRSVFLPVGRGLDIAHVAVGESGSGSNKVGKSGWIKRVDRESGEEFLIRNKWLAKIVTSSKWLVKIVKNATSKNHQVKPFSK
ncbi:hypothetical protein L6452_31488 [Arctium lappa]|uniref:Uncharacterized protein n=1 Tax=Arctium lappa TaxID=4217 RepID=A0ACB8Z1W8_ARCLA|nr:hypothetical protein L6452_31488 [Arctium lappa]